MTPTRRTFTPTELDDLDVPGEHMVEKRVTSTRRRWATDHEGVFAHPDGTHWLIKWQMPATESQECDIWYDQDVIIGVAVEQREVSVSKWMPIEETATTAAPRTPVTLSAETLDQLADDANTALNDYHHANQCGCRTWPQECATARAIPSSRYAPGHWDSGDFHTAFPLIADRLVQAVLTAQANTAAPDINEPTDEG